ncbi:MAG: hypothetical protein JRF33_09890 [Deltaproteobacteria bacterium]|nr:hypothetical protein [Deltaproteobacteria bacterium]
MALAEGDLKRFVTLKEELRIRNTFLESNVLLREASRAQKADDPEKAEILLDTAVLLSPDLASTHLARASFILFERPTDLAEVLGSLLDAGKAAWREPFSFDRMKTNAIVGLLLGLILAAFLFVIVQFLTYLKLFLHDFHHLFPRAAARFQTTVLALLLLALPLMFRLGLVLTLMIWLLTAFLYQNWRERAISIMLLLLLGATPFALREGLAGLMMPDSAAGVLLEVERGSPTDKQLSRLKALLAEHPDHTGLLTVLGNHFKRQGQYEMASAILLKALDTKPASAILLNNLGNVYFLQDELGKAVGMYGRACMADPGLALPHYNLSQTHYRAGEPDKGTEARQSALRLDREGIRKVTVRANTGQVNYVVGELDLPMVWLTGAADIGVSRELLDDATAALWNTWGGRGDPFSFWFYALGALLIYLLAALFGWRVSLSRACVRCGRPACRRCNNEMKDDTHCGQCFYAFVRKEQVDARARISKEIQIRQYKRRHESLACGLSFVLPGIGQMLKERTLRGVLILLVFALVLVQVLLGYGLMRDPLALGGGIDWLKLVPLLVLFAAFYAWALLDVFRSNDA